MQALRTKADQVQVGDILVYRDERWSVIQIEEERLGLEMRLRNEHGAGRVKFFLSDELVVVEL
jgi:hypothetical protein